MVDSFRSHFQTRLLQLASPSPRRKLIQSDAARKGNSSRIKVSLNSIDLEIVSFDDYDPDISIQNPQSLTPNPQPVDWKASTMPSVKFVKEKKTIEIPEGSNLRDEARKAGFEVHPGIHKSFFFNCHGHGMCCSCRVLVKQGQENISKRGIWEKLSLLNFLNPFGFFAKIGHEDELRLSCQTKVYGDVEVETQPEFNWHGEKFWG